MIAYRYSVTRGRQGRLAMRRVNARSYAGNNSSGRFLLSRRARNPSDRPGIIVETETRPLNFSKF